MEKGSNFYMSDAQLDFINSDKNSVLFCGGLGSGKTYSGAVWAAYMALTYPGCRGMITANTHSQLRKATLTQFFSILESMGVKFRYLINSNEIHIQGGSIIYAYSMENYDNLRGVEVGWCWSDECAFYKEIAYQVLRGRIRDKRGTCQWKGTTTPNGFNWLYDRFVMNPPTSSEIVYAKTTDNLDNLADSYVEELTQQYDKKLAQQELDGQFVNLTSGKVYYGFDREKNVKDLGDIKGHLIVGLDFNVNPLCGVYGIVSKNLIYVVDELYMEDSNTFKAAKKILTDKPGRYIQVVADSTGDRRKTNAVNTDHEILRRAGLDVLKFRNPYVKDRVNNINRLFDHEKIVIHPRCKKLILDLEQLVYDNKDDMLSHISDALGYLAWKKFPLHKPKKQVEIRNR
jgi:PBSX family phage terminase large subunit